MKFCHFVFIVILFCSNLVIKTVSADSLDDKSNFISLIKVGDWIFRKGVQIDSVVINQLGGGDFSHIGFIIATEPEVRVIHATTGDNENLPNQVIISTIDEFTTPSLAQKYAIARPHFLSDHQQQLIVAELLTKQGAPFVLASRDEDHLYCTTLLYDAIVKIYPEFNLEWKYANFPLFNGIYLFPSAFADYEGITWIYRYSEN
ncbi:YiiX/YebB-like N1pC/P60 family cysteine hydrolase [Gilliamella sp. wkB308]|uniref:YiiX/YebB-like N1pC/P60 family cysteine hydrolase n=1 Tax=Gilliamella sp. wkB308 TaxID=3120263 RepID=UPI00080E332B|nr:YiiX/YebB-like N1pC/P60 family cysteine hydrolase [Gilliamella apicola]OCG01715.1 hypothetical protein A9G10_03055 [Gilliamella apicola]